MNEAIFEYQRVYKAALGDLKANPDVLAVFVFGSMVNGDLWEKSDIDFFVILKEAPPGMANVYSDYHGKTVHFKAFSKEEYFATKGFDLKGSFLHRLLISSRLVYCQDPAIEETFASRRNYPDQSRKIWTLAYAGKVVTGIDSVRKSLVTGNCLAAYATLVDTMNWYAMLRINRKGYLVSKDNINLASDLFDDFRDHFAALVGPGDLKDRVVTGVNWVLERMDREIQGVTEVLHRYLAEQAEPVSAGDFQKEAMFAPYHIEAEALLSLLHQKGLVKKSYREYGSKSGGLLIRENIYCL